jgi:succinate-semialdehyde dehydrogenase/glutarate-semialdehyde dehydrogenase
MSSPARKVGGALSSGCSIILKASEETPAGAVQLVRAFHDAGLPPGVLNLVFGNPAEISNYLIPQSSIRLITFTGSIPVGKSLAEMAGRHMKPAIMELGGHAPVIVCDDVDPVTTSETSVAGKSRNAGQVCVSPTRFFVQESIYQRFADSFAEKAAQLKVGDGLDPRCRWDRWRIRGGSMRWRRWSRTPNRKAPGFSRAGAGSAIAAISSLLPFSPMCRIMRAP